MEFSEQIKFKKVNILHSGRFYWIHVISHCYRINEVDHYLKDLYTDILCFLDNRKNCHHFNRVESKYSGVTTLQEIFSIPNIKNMDFFEFDQNTINSVQGDTVVSDIGDDTILRKLVSSFHDKQKTEEGSEYLLEDLKAQYMKEYIHSLDLKN
ncbi:MAG: hypothetical protein HQM14_15210 [SAR324 cluster bacterium]|nr:hypothetical protein [SAR324 cluster bacterium]